MERSQYAKVATMRPEVEQVLALTRRRDSASLEEALALLQKTAFSFSMKVCGQRQDAEDTMQEVLVQSLSYLPKFNNPKALAVWLYKVAKSRCLMSRRRSKFAPHPELSLEALMPNKSELRGLTGKAAETPEETAIRRDNAEQLREAMKKLPIEYRLIVVLRDMEDLSDDQVAEITGLKPGTVRVRLHRARLFLRKELARSKRSLKPLAHRTAHAPSPVSPHIPSSRCKALFAELSTYLDGEMDYSLCRELEKHLEGCVPCEAFLSSLEQTIDRCRRTPTAVPDARKAAKMRRDLLSQYQQAMKGLARNSKNARVQTSTEAEPAQN